MRSRRETLLWVALAVTSLVLAGALIRVGRAAGEIAAGREETLVVAHRAGAALGPENTLAALKRSVEAGADMAEIDVRLTGDGVPVALHDSNLSRTTGSDREVGETDLTDLEGLDAGSWFGEAFAGEPIPTLAQMLDAAKGHIRLMLELKAGGPETELVEAVTELIRERGMEEACVLASSSAAILALCQERAPELKRVYITRALYPGLGAVVPAGGYSIDRRWAGAAAVVQAHGEGRELYIWTANSAKELERLLALGPDGVITDDPVLAREILEKEGEAA